MKFRLLFTKIDTQMSIVTLGSVCLLIAQFIGIEKPNIILFSIFSVSGSCLILSGAILIYRETAIKSEILPIEEKREKGEKLDFNDITRIGRLGYLNIIAHSLFDIGILILLLGTIFFLLSTLSTIWPFIKDDKIRMIILIIFTIGIFIRNFFTRRYFE